MPYARFDDRWHDHKKVMRAARREPAAALMHAMAITYCNQHNTNGDVDEEWIDDRLAVLPLTVKQRQRVKETMLDTGLFERRDPETLHVHDFLDWNLSREQRDELAARGRRGGQAKAQANGKPGPGDGSSPGSSPGHSDGHSPGSSEGSSTPTPTPTPRENPVVAAAPPPPPDDPVERAVDDLCHLMSHHVRVAHGIDPKSGQAKVTSGWRAACRGLLTLDTDDETGEPYRREQVAFAIEWVCRHHYWSRRIKSMTRLRSEMPEVAKDIRRQRSGGGNVVRFPRRETASDWLREDFIAGVPVVDAEPVDEDGAA